jgi:hypothetical protein
MIGRSYPPSERHVRMGLPPRFTRPEATIRGRSARPRRSGAFTLRGYDRSQRRRQLLRLAAPTEMRSRTVVCDGTAPRSCVRWPRRGCSSPSRPLRSMRSRARDADRRQSGIVSGRTALGRLVADAWAGAGQGRRTLPPALSPPGGRLRVGGGQALASSNAARTSPEIRPRSSRCSRSPPPRPGPSLRRWPGGTPRPPSRDVPGPGRAGLPSA